MKLHMNLCDVDLWFEIYNYIKPSKEHEMEWCKINFSLKSTYINYHIDGWEMFLNEEVDKIKQALAALLNGDIKEPCNISFAEPDIEFDLSPITTFYDVPGKVYFKNGFTTFDISIDFKINFWCKDGALGSNTFVMTLDREEIKALYTYLQLVAGEVDKSSEAVEDCIDKGYIYL